MDVTYLPKFNPDYALANLKEKSKSKELFHSSANQPCFFIFKAILSTSLLSIFSKYEPTAKVLYLNLRLDKVF